MLIKKFKLNKFRYREKVNREEKERTARKKECKIRDERRK